MKINDEHVNSWHEVMKYCWYCKELVWPSVVSYDVVKSYEEAEVCPYCEGILSDVAYWEYDNK